MNSPSKPTYPGFLFLPLSKLPDLGYGTVEIHIGSAPIERFFDTRQAIFPVIDEGSLTELIIEHPLLSEGTHAQHHICAGRFRFYEKDGDEHQGYSLGGDLEIRQDDEWISCSLTSSAPIFNLQEDPLSSNHWLVDEIEGILARRRASYGENDNIFLDRLQALDPFVLFIAALALVNQDMQALSPAGRASYQVQYDHIRHFIHTLDAANEWPTVPPSINELL
jgi:hypothetical protein